MITRIPGAATRASRCMLHLGAWLISGPFPTRRPPGLARSAIKVLVLGLDPFAALLVTHVVSD